MVDQEHARRIAEILLDPFQAQIDEKLVFVEPPLRFSGGWIFVYDSERYIETRELSAAVGGNAPIAVFESGEVELLSSASSLQTHLQRLNARGDESRL
jgi:hypothetical protein